MYTVQKERFPTIIEQSVSLLSHADEVATLKSLLTALIMYDDATNAHAHRMVHWSVATARYLRLSKEEISLLHLATLLDDIGKIEVPTAILHKADSLTCDEWSVMRDHAAAGYRILHNAGGVFTSVAPIVLTHHERWDGSGYPLGLRKEEIPLAARIVAVVDSFDAMTETRPYKRARTFIDACAELKKNAGELYDPRVVNSFLTVIHTPSIIHQVASSSPLAA